MQLNEDRRCTVFKEVCPVWCMIFKNLHENKILYDIMLYIIQNQLQIQQKV